MKHFPILRLLAFGVILLTAMAFSCEDHNIPDPVTNCNRVDGTPRPFDCEFEMTKIEFLYPRTKTVAGTVTKADPNVRLPGSAAIFFSYNPRDGWVSSRWLVRATIKRIAQPHTSNSSQYLYRQILPFDYNNQHYESHGTNWGEILPDDSLQVNTWNIPMGGTQSFEMEYGIDGPFGGIYYVLVQNKNTSKLLREAPYNYTF